MADKNWLAGGKILIPAQALACAIATIAPFGAAWGISNRQQAMWAPPTPTWFGKC
jgi:hypothetical protein